MRFSAPLLTVVGTVAGAGAAVVAYQTAAAPVTPVTRTVSDATVSRPAAPGTSWLPCEHGWKVQGTTCVRIQHRVVVVHDLPAPAAPAAQTATQTAPPQAPAAPPAHAASGGGHAESHHSDGTQTAEHADDSAGETEQGDSSGTEDVGGGD